MQEQQAAQSLVKHHHHHHHQPQQQQHQQEESVKEQTMCRMPSGAMQRFRWRLLLLCPRTPEHSSL
jgi:hypothetical protein